MTARAGDNPLKAPSLLSGWLAVMFLAANALSGLWLWLNYETGTAAYDSILSMESVTCFGGFARALHYFSSHFLVAAVLIHFILLLARLGDHAAWGKGTWASGVAAGALGAAVAFSGKILPMDMHGGVSLVMLESFLPWGDVGLKGLFSDGRGPRVGALLWMHVAGAAVFGLLLAGHVRGAVASAEASSESIAPRLRIGAGAVAGFLLVAASALFAAPLGCVYDERLAGVHVSAEWYLRWLQFLAESSPAALRIVPAGLLIMALVTPPACRTAGAGRVQALWMVLILIVGFMSILGGR